MRETDKEIKNNILKSNQFTHSSIMIRKNMLDKVWWLYDKKYNWVEDYELWLRVGTVSQFYNIPEYLTKYRWLETSISRKNQKLQQFKSIQLCFQFRKYYNKSISSILSKSLFLIATSIITEQTLKHYLWKLKK